MRIYKKRFYTVEKRVWDAMNNPTDKHERSIITGTRAQCRNGDSDIIVGEAYVQPHLRYELDDGHLPGFRPVVLGMEAREFLANNPYQRIKKVE
jgi:hypothetical protein